MDESDFVGRSPTNVERPKTCSFKYMNIHKKTPVPNFNFNKVPGLKSVKTKTHWHKRFRNNFSEQHL